MKSSLTKIIAGLSVSLFAVSTAFGAANAGDNKYDQGHGVEANQMGSGYCAPARIDVSGAYDFYIDADFLWWQVGSDDQAYGLAADAAYTAVPSNMTVLMPSFKWRPGFKVSLGTNFSHDDWTLHAEYTWIRGKAEGSSAAPSGGTIVPSLFATLDLPAIGAAHASTRTSYQNNVVDLVLGRPFYLGSKLVIKPFFGLKGFWNKLANHKEYTTVSYVYYTTDDTNVLYNTGTSDWMREDLTLKIWGVGPRAGTDAHWILGSGFRIEGDIAANLLYNRLSASGAETSHDAIAGSEVTRVDGHEPKLDSMRPVLESAIGLGWGTYFSHSNWHFDVSAMYEGQFWYHFVRVASEVGGDMWSHGATVKLRLDF